MANYFTLVSYHKEGERKEKYLNVQRNEGLLSISRGLVNPLGKSISEITRELEENYSDEKRIVNNIANYKVCFAKSLKLFSSLKPGDIIFVRGEAEIIDIVIVDSLPFFHDGNNQFDERLYYLKVHFTPLFKKNLSITTEFIKNNCSEPFYKNIIGDTGDDCNRHTPMHKLEIEENAQKLLKLIFDNN